MENEGKRGNGRDLKQNFLLLYKIFLCMDKISLPPLIMQKSLGAGTLMEWEILCNIMAGSHWVGAVGLVEFLPPCISIGVYPL